jgi:ethanolamine ammonia-lyase small subunit
MIQDPWSRLRRFTPARIALGRAGSSLPTAAWLAFAADHADARDAVYAELDVPAFTASAEPLGLPVLPLRTAATDRTTYLQRPDLGRRLDPASASAVKAAAGDYDVTLIIADGLSATAITRNAIETLTHLLPKLRGLSIAPLCVVTQARVGVMDEIGAGLGARSAVILIGERPGLAVPDSVGAYLTYAPAIGNTDATRNCVSNIRPAGLPPAAGAEAIAWLLNAAITRKLSGVALKDDRDPATLLKANA